MCSDSHQQYLTSSDMAMLERVLAHPELLKPTDGPALQDGAAKYLIRKYQEGLTDEGELTLALDRYVRVWRAWWSRPQHSAKILPFLAAAKAGPTHVMPDFPS
ncbi:hypothetical protein [Mesorhizobium sp. KR2-14]|uniref:hypothetical protein n=1 Tax=Mesorhizobium sp. KR2-14 TaxID=3156610 RepID=UPI0032B33A7E